MVKQKLWLALLAFFFLLGSCAPAPETIVGNPQDMIATIAAATVAALPTNTPQPTWTASLPPTIQRSTPTELPSNTPAPTIAMLDTPTSAFVLPGPGTPLSGGSGLPVGIWTWTPEPYKCDLNKTDPEPYTYFRPGQRFRAEWRVWNRGSIIWKADRILFYFIGGDKLFTDPERAKGIELAYSVYPEDKILVHAMMMAPKQPGTYASTWGLRRDNSALAFCTFDLVIRVK